MRSRIALVALVALASGVCRADVAPVIDCPWYSPTVVDTFQARAFYAPSYPGTSLRTVTLYLRPGTAGTYPLTLKARTGTFDGTLLGTATTSFTFADNASPVPVVFDFGNVSVPLGSIVTFAGGGTGSIYMQVVSSPACPMFETDSFLPPLGAYRRQGVAARITGDLPAKFPHSATVPAAASIHGANGAFFHTDLWLHNSDGYSVEITATYHCYEGQSCGSGTKTITVGGGKGLSIPDVVGSFFGAPETAGALVLKYSSNSSVSTVKVLSRTYTPSLPSPTNGASMPGVPITSASGDSTFVGLGNNGGDRSAGFRTNAGVFNPFLVPATVTFELRTAAGVVLGSATQTWAAHEARQVNDVFGTLGTGGTVTTDAILNVTSDIPVFSYVTVIDNQTGDSVIQ